MNWIPLKEQKQLAQILEQSTERAVLIFKHSTRCSISRTALDRLERNWSEEEMKQVTSYFLDLISYRDISNEVASQFNVEHESPQVLLIKNGKAVFNYSHFEIDYNDIRKHVIKN